DNTFALLVGDDKLPDLAVGRVAVKQDSDLSNIVDKIIQYEENHLFSSGWMENIIFVADNEDDAGSFCLESMDTGDQLPASLNSIYLCLDDYDGLDSDLLRKDLTLTVKSGVSLLNYRGHGSPSSWANIWSTANNELWENTLRPFVSLSGDCLDGNFALPWWPGLGEGLTKATDDEGNPVGAAAHWGSTGLGTSYNHSRLINAFYHALFVDGQTRVGEAIMTAKGFYGLDPNNDRTLLSSFTLIGDPAMQLYQRSLAVDLNVTPQSATPGDMVTYTIAATNQGVFPTHTTISHTLPAGFNFVSVYSTLSTTFEITGSGVVFDLQFGESLKDKGIPRNGDVTLIVTVEILPDAFRGNYESTATITGTGEEAWPGDETSMATVSIIKPSVYIPFINR
ncbi:MAG TPA: C25 family cysteine peptidase, partial [candidate division Zixibacteria bacterium]|nr:C25 family cysteine peptidase [candidate division Zixibacteria bacterium]